MKLRTRKPIAARGLRPARRQTNSLCLHWLLPVLMIALSLPAPSYAGPDLDTENSISQFMIQSASPSLSGPNVGKGQTVEKRAKTHNGQSAILPQIGVNPSEGLLVGAEYANRNFTSDHLSIDTGAVYALRGQREFNGTLIVPRLFTLFGRPVMNLVELKYFSDPTKEFFGLGNNNVGPNPLSTHEIRRYNALETLGWRLTPRLTIALTAGFNQVSISKGERDENNDPYTVDLFPNLVGIHGGMTNPVALSLVYDDRKDLTRPSRGWNVFAKVQHVGPELASDYRYTRFVVSASYLYPIFNRRHILGLRIKGQYMDAATRKLPFFELPTLGGSETMRGYYKDRFRGQSDLLFTLEYRQFLADFNFYNIWHVRLDGVLFGDAGRVFLNARDRQNTFRINSDLIPRVFQKFRYDYGGGLRIALGQALVARVDAGFSKEEKGLVYLTFGQTF